MKKRRSYQREKAEVKLWTFAEAERALPYVRSILQSLRENALEVNRLELQRQRLAAKPGRPTRADLITLDNLQHEVQAATDRYHADLEELQAFGVGCVDPIAGEAIFPFLYEQQVAWFLYNLFEGPHLRWWRFDTDSLNTRRPIYNDMKNDNRLAVV
jgi:hypothetical protein